MTLDTWKKGAYVLVSNYTAYPNTLPDWSDMIQDNIRSNMAKVVTYMG
jgi:hypothetical protein